jgi:hypothetical protein
MAFVATLLVMSFAAMPDHEVFSAGAIACGRGSTDAGAPSVDTAGKILAADPKVAIYFVVVAAGFATDSQLRGERPHRTW